VDDTPICKALQSPTLTPNWVENSSSRRDPRDLFVNIVCSQGVNHGRDFLGRREQTTSGNAIFPFWGIGAAPRG